MSPLGLEKADYVTMTLLETLETWKRHGINPQGLSTTAVIGKIGRVEK